METLIDRSIYLKVRKEILTISATDGKWNRKRQEEIFSKIDRDVERWNCVGFGDKKTDSIKVKIFDVINAGTYKQIIPGIGTNFFENLTQGVQVFRDNPSLIKEIMDSSIHILIPFKSHGKKDKYGSPIYFVARIFKLDKKIELRVSKFTRKDIWSMYIKIAVIIPHLNNEEN